MRISCRLLDVCGLRLQLVQVGDGALRMRGSRENKALFIGQNGEPEVVFAKLYDRKTPITAAEILNDRVLPFFEEHGIVLVGDD